MTLLKEKTAELGLLLMQWGMKPAYVVIYDTEEGGDGDVSAENYYGYFADPEEAAMMFAELNHDGRYTNAKVCMVLAEIEPEEAEPEPKLQTFAMSAKFCDIDGDEGSMTFKGEFVDMDAARYAMNHKLDAAGATKRDIEVRLVPEAKTDV